MKTTARQFFEIWQAAVRDVAFIRFMPSQDHMVRTTLFQGVLERHGEAVALEAVAYMDKLRADTTKHSAGGGSCW